jgi:hypothetical protein
VGDPGLHVRSLAIDGTGLGIAAWDKPIPGGTTVEVAEELSPGVWTTREPAAGLGERNGSPVVAAGPDGAALVTWVHAGTAAGVYLSERSASAVWSDPAPGQQVSFGRAGVEPWVAAAPSGEQILAWCQETRTGWGVALARRAGPTATWVRPRDAEDVVSPDVLFANQPQIALDARGDALVAWYQSEGAPLMTYVSERRGPSGAFSRPGARDFVSAGGAPVDSDPVANPKPALGPHGEAAVVWVQENGAGARPVYMATRDPRGTWTRPRDLGDAFSRPAGAARDARAAFGPEGELYVLWMQDGAIYAARRDPRGRWIDPGQTPALLSTPGKTAYGPALAAGPEGGVIAAWVEEDTSCTEHVAVRRTGGDRPGWEVLEPVSKRGDKVGPPAVAMGPGDRTLVAWVSGGPGSTRVVFARIE